MLQKEDCIVWFQPHPCLDIFLAYHLSKLQYEDNLLTEAIGTLIHFVNILGQRPRPRQSHANA